MHCAWTPAGLAQEPGHLISKTGSHADAANTPGMTLDQRAVMLATAVSVDFDYFSRHGRRGGGIMPGFWPTWLPGGGGGGAAEEAGALEGAEGPRAPTGTEAAAGAGGVAGYELYDLERRNEHGADAPVGPDPSGLQNQGRDYGGNDVEPTDQWLPQDPGARQDV